jgi:hypothetical protein
VGLTSLLALVTWSDFVVDVREPSLPAAWRLSLFRDAGEASGAFVATFRSSYRGVRGAAADPERSRAESARRSRTALRRYCAANGLNRLGTLTYAGAGCHDPVQLRADLAEFWRGLRGRLGGSPLPYVWVPEWHPRGHGLHAHFAVGRFVKQSLIEAAWGRGFVSIKRLTDLPVGSTSWDEARKAAGYLSKYVTKSFDADLGGLHRYDVAQGFKPARLLIEGVSSEDVLAQACVVMDARPGREWSSRDSAGWQGPPAVWFAWG